MIKSKVNFLLTSFFHSKKIAVYFFLLSAILISVPIIDLFTPIPEKAYVVSLTGILGLSLVCLENNVRFKLSLLDKLILLFIGYQLLHFFLLSKASVFDGVFWIRIAFLVSYFLIKIVLINHKKLAIQMLLFILSLKVFAEMLLGILQYPRVITASKTEYFTVAGTHRSPNYFAYTLAVGLLLSCWYFLYYRKKLSFEKKSWLLIFLLITVLLFIKSESRAAFVALFVCTILFLFKTKIVALTKLNLRIKAVGVLLVILFCGIGSKLLYEYKKDSANGRLLVTKITLGELKNKPLLGHGLFSFEKGYNTAKASYFKETKRAWNEIKVGDYILSAMNDYLEISYEIGILGLLLLLLIFIRAISKMSSSKYAVLGFLIFVFMAITALFSSVHRHNSLVIYGIIGFCIMQYPFSTEEKKIKGNRFLKIQVFVFSLTLISIGGFRIYAERFISIQLKNKARIAETPVEDWNTWTTIYALNGLSEFGYGNVLYDGYSKKEEGLEIMGGSLSKNIKPKNVRRLARYYFSTNQFSKAKELFELNTYTEPFRFEPKMDLVRFYRDTKDKEMLCKKAQEVIDFPVKVPSGKVSKYKAVCKGIIEGEGCID